MLALNNTRISQGGYNQIDWANPLTKNLLFVGIPGASTDPVSGRIRNPLGSGASLELSDVGRVYRFTGSQSSGAVSWGPARVLPDGTNRISMLVFFKTSNLSSPKLFSKWGGGHEFLIQSGASGVMTVALLNSGGGFIVENTPAFSFSANIQQVCGVTSSGPEGFLKIYAAGREVHSAAVSYTALKTNSTDDLQIGVANDGDPLNGDIHFAALWDRVLSAQEMLSISLNPFQILR